MAQAAHALEEGVNPQTVTAGIWATLRQGEAQALREQLADVQHEIWSHWMRYMFTKGTFNDDCTWTMPADKVQRWQRQGNILYSLLSPEEQESDRHQADKVIAVLAGEAGQEGGARR